MNYLELSQRLVQEAGIAGGGPATVTGQTGIKKKVVDWIARAWTEIQNQQNWDFLWATTSFTTTVAQRDYDPVDNLQLDPALSLFITDSFRIYTTSTGLSDQGSLEYVDWATWSTGTQGKGAVSSGKPSQFTILPDDTIRLNATPDLSYTIDFDYYRTPVELSANSDTPALPAQFHDIILYQAMIYYAAHEDAPELYQDANSELDLRMSELMKHSPPGIEITMRPLA